MHAGHKRREGDKITRALTTTEAAGAGSGVYIQNQLPGIIPTFLVTIFRQAVATYANDVYKIVFATVIYHPSTILCSGELQLCF